MCCGSNNILINHEQGQKYLHYVLYSILFCITRQTSWLGGRAPKADLSTHTRSWLTHTIPHDSHRYMVTTALPTMTGIRCFSSFYSWKIKFLYLFLYLLIQISWQNHNLNASNAFFTVLSYNNARSENCQRKARVDRFFSSCSLPFSTWAKCHVLMDVVVTSIERETDHFCCFAPGPEIAFPFAACKENSMLTEWGTSWLSTRMITALA